MFWMRTLKELRKRKPTSAVAKWLVRFYGLSLLPANEVEVAFDDVSGMPDDERFRKFADYVSLSRKLSRWWMRLSTNYVGWKSGSQSSHYQWLRVISCTFKCWILGCSTKHLLETLLRQQTYTYISLASLLQSWPVRKNRREKCAFLRRMYTDYRAGHLSRKEYLQRVSYRFCPAWMFFGICHDLEFFSHIFHTLSFILFLDLDCFYFTCIYVRFRNNMSVRFHTTILCVSECEKTCGLRFHNTPFQYSVSSPVHRAARSKRHKPGAP